MGEEGEIPQRGPVRKTHKLIQQQFKSISEQRWEKFLHQWAQEEEQVHRTEVEREEITSLGQKEVEEKNSGFQLANKKSKAINHVREPSFLAAPTRQQQNEIGQD